MGAYYCRFHWLPQMKKSKGGLVKNFLLPRHIAACATAQLFFLIVYLTVKKGPFLVAAPDRHATEMREMFSLLVDAYRYLRCMDRNESLVTRLEKGEYFLPQVQRWRIC